MQKTPLFQVHTERLTLIPLTPELLRLWLDDIPTLEEKLHATYRGESLSEEYLQSIVEMQLERMPYFDETQDTEYAWYTFWLILLNETHEIIGSFDIKRGIDETGRIEIGYGLAASFQHQGYMSETIQGFLKWAYLDPRLRTVMAETETGNTASQKVLKRCGFSPVSEAETLWWRYNMP